MQDLKIYLLAIRIKIEKKNVKVQYSTLIHTVHIIFILTHVKILKIKEIKFFQSPQSSFTRGNQHFMHKKNNNKHYENNN